MTVRQCIDCGVSLPVKVGRPPARCQACSARRPCAVEGCVSPRNRRHNVCAMHFKRKQATGEYGPPEALRSYGTPDGRRPPAGTLGACAVKGCDAPHRIRGYCQMHEARLRTTGSLGEAARKIARKNEGDWFVDNNGYRVRLRDGKQQLEHRVVMEAMLGRLLRSFENVHHLNGVRHDNRPQNLELWTKPQPPGQRPEDLVAWVVEHYPEIVRQALAATTA